MSLLRAAILLSWMLGYRYRAVACLLNWPCVVKKKKKYVGVRDFGDHVMRIIFRILPCGLFI